LTPPRWLRSWASGRSHDGHISEAGGVAGVGVVKGECALTNTVGRRPARWAGAPSDISDSAVALAFDGGGMAAQVFHLIEQASR
jgi:hypothetical protein